MNISEKAQLFAEHYLGYYGVNGVGISWDTDRNPLIKVSLETGDEIEKIPDEFLGTPIWTEVVGKIFLL